ncbi:TauD/TfdA dioxygenase family protein [Sphingomonas montanisoli]|uniref:TauD/TfdA family dioxygenase n=1 Tax=Sphingomonas montanisoli TaxID=2606412 RepID=A0A5D9C930_9SPHN|nr:TauD/TfdA family dioxygenase [Sphingomonas montanisoli]TZG27896.1 TauD/TfdA family dioxygenase [Sphingomonas montanisoli]
MTISYDNQPDPSSPLDIAPVTGRIGGEVRGIKLGPDISDADVAAIEAALARHKVLFFRDQDHLTDESQEAFANRLGRPVAHPTLKVAPGSSYILELATAENRVASVWHTDVTFTADYPRASILRGVDMPPAGGDTMWINTVTAYKYLPDTLKQLAESLRVIHTNMFDYLAPSPVQNAKSSDFSAFTATRFETEHPMVRVHPVTGEKLLLLGGFAREIVGLPKADSDALLAMFTRHVEATENIVRWHWRTGDLVIWDNRATQHKVAADLGNQTRVVRRVTLAGEVPVGVDGRQSVQIHPEPLAVAAE